MLRLRIVYDKNTKGFRIQEKRWIFWVEWDSFRDSYKTFEQAEEDAKFELRKDYEERVKQEAYKPKEIIYIPEEEEREKDLDSQHRPIRISRNR